MAKRINTLFSTLKEKQQAALIPFITAGDPDLKTTLALMHTLVENGADLIELGMAFSDPMAEGVTIQHACERAIAQGVMLPDVLDIVTAFRKTNTYTPIVLMGYTNPIEIMGYALFAERAAKAGVDGVIVVDLPVEESHDLQQACLHHQMDMIFLLAPTSTSERIKTVSQLASGYLYYVSRKGVTGQGQVDVEDVKKHIDRIRAASDLPVTIGFGIKNADIASQLAPLAQGIVVGSALVEQIANAGDDCDACCQVAATFMQSLSKIKVTP